MIRKRLRQCSETQTISRETPLRDTIVDILKNTFDFAPRLPTQLCLYVL